MFIINFFENILKSTRDQFKRPTIYRLKTHPSNAKLRELLGCDITHNFFLVIYCLDTAVCILTRTDEVHKHDLWNADDPIKISPFQTCNKFPFPVNVPTSIYTWKRFSHFTTIHTSVPDGSNCGMQSVMFCHLSFDGVNVIYRWSNW